MFAGELIDKATALSNKIDELDITMDYLRSRKTYVYNVAIAVLQDESDQCLQKLNRLRQQEVTVNG